MHGVRESRVLAIIPARAGSKRIPNKNMRVVGSRPLVSYVIERALKSSRITDIVVTTDSSEVAIVAKQMGVQVHDRPAQLCGDDVPLDSVVWDVLSSTANDYDYIVTLQPTTPSLKSETIDAAIAYSEEQDFDTVISVINRPGLNWIQKDDHVVPGYTERLNSQYLPANYCETGSFLISKSDIITETSRVGGRVGVYEVTPDEAISINTFQDLALAKVILSNESIGFFVNGNNELGVGHVSRVLQLADEFYAKPKIYYDFNQTDEKLFNGSTYETIGVDGVDGLLEALKKDPCNIFVNDILSTSEEYMTELRAVLPHARIINFEDEGPGALLADAVINALLEKTNIRNAKTGSSFYIVPKTFLIYQPITIHERVSRVLVTFGGADPMGYTERVLDIIFDNLSDYQDVVFEIVLGPAKKKMQCYEQYKQAPNMVFHENISNMPEIMSRCDIAISSRGRTCFELAVMGVPTISIAQNKREETHTFVSHESGFDYLGFDPSDGVIKANIDLYIGLSKAEREKIQSQLLKSDLRNGRNRVINFIHSL